MQLAGSAIPNLDPAFYTQVSLSHQTTPLTSAFAAGTNELITAQKGWIYAYQESFLTGTTA